MSDLSSQSPSIAALADVAALPEVRLEMRQGKGRTTAYTVSDLGFLIGTVPGCDLRMPGSGLPAVLGLVSRSDSGVTFRKLAPTQAILINGQSASHAPLHDGDRVTVGAVDLFVHIQQEIRSQESEVRDQRSEVSSQKSAELEELSARLDERQKQLDEQTRALEADRVLWYERRQEIEREISQKKTWKKEGAHEDLAEREHALAGQVADLAARESDLQARFADLDKHKQELAGTRQDLADIRKQLYERYQERRDRLAGLQEAVNRAAQKVQERKRQVDAEAVELQNTRFRETARQTELQAHAADIADLVHRLEEERHLFQESKTTYQAELKEKLAHVEAREQALSAAHQELEKNRQQYQADLIRLDRLQGALDTREKELEAKGQEIDQRLEHLQHDSGELEDQVHQAEELRVQVNAEAERLAQQKEEQQALSVQLAQRAAALEGQQATMAALRTRLERMREEVRREEQQLGQERLRQEQAEAELQQHLEHSMKLRAELDSEQKLRDQERQQLVERGAVLEAAVNQLRLAQDKLGEDEEKLRQRALELDQKTADHGVETGHFQGRITQLEEARLQLEAERQALREREKSLANAEELRGKLQDQLRRRAEELAARQRELAEQAAPLQAQALALEAQRTDLAQQQQLAHAQQAARQQELEATAADLARLQEEHQKRQDDLHRQWSKLQEAGRSIGAARKALAQEQARIKMQGQELAEAQVRQRDEFDSICRQAKELLHSLPDLELRAGTALTRLTGAREQLKDHIGEVHAYAQQCQEDLDGLRGQIQAEADRLQQKEQTLRRLQDEHRLAVAGFRQQLIDWQGQVAEKKRLLVHDETRLERKEAQVSEQVRQIDATKEELAQKAEDLQEKERAVAGRRQLMDRHLSDMREWYRGKLRDLAGIEAVSSQSAGEPAALATGEFPGGDDVPDAEEAETPVGRDILSLSGPADEADRRLGDLLRSLELVEADALTALLTEARRQRRSLRQILLAGGVVTLYQMALIEAGNIAALMLGPVRVVDRLRTTPRETVYLVFDPRRGSEAILRHLAEAELDPAHADEFRQCFIRAQGVDHPHLARTLEVLDIAARPVVLQECLSGLPCPEWPPLASVPGVCFRLLSQAALGLATIHDAGLMHGHLSAHLLLLTDEGILKICGLGEPSWLAGVPNAEPASVAGDLAALGAIAAGWSTVGVRKGAKTKPLPPSLRRVIDRLQSRTEPYPSAAALLDDLDIISRDIPANAEAWSANTPCRKPLCGNRRNIRPRTQFTDAQIHWRWSKGRPKVGGHVAANFILHNSKS